MNVRPALKAIGNFARKNAGRIFAAGAITSEILGFWFMHREAPIVRDRLNALPEDAKWTDKIKAAGPVYLPAIGMLVLSTGCIIGGCASGERKVALLTGLYSASEATLRKMEDKVIEKFGPEKAQEIQDSIAQDLMKQNPPTKANVIATGLGDDLCFDPLSGRYFTASQSAVERAVNQYNKLVIGDMWASVNEWYDALNLEHVDLGDDRGWNVDRLLEVYFTSRVTPDGKPCLVLNYTHTPVMYNHRENDW